MVRRAASRNPELAGRALAGLAAYQQAPRNALRAERPVAERIGPTTLRDCGGTGAPILLVPSLINPPNVLDLDDGSSLAEALTTAGRVLLLDWGPATERALSIIGHVDDLLVPLVRRLGGSATLIGYCLGGTMALAAAGRAPCRAVATLASPWRFSAYGHGPRAALQRLWDDARPAAESLGLLPVEVLQSAFWSLDPDRVVGKYARLADLDPTGAEARRFVALEDWANGGEPLPLEAARELMEELFAADRPGQGIWSALPSCPALHFTAANDRIVPAVTAAPGDTRACPAGHVGMIVGRSAPAHLHAPLIAWLEGLGPRR